MVSSFYKWLLLLLPGSLFCYSETSSYRHSVNPIRASPSASLWRPKGGGVLHPFHVSVVEINHNAADKTLEISCKLFTDDFEKVLAQNYKTRVDLINPPDKAAMDTLVKKYISSHLSINADGKPGKLMYVGFERESEAVYGYMQVDGIASVKKIDITNKLMYDLFTDQVNLVHVIVGGNRKSTKLDYPESNAGFEFY
jgi:hypothetical protein